MDRLRAAERERHAAVGELVQLGVVRSRVLVGDIGEQIVARFYGLELAPAFTPGYDLIDRHGRRVQVSALRATPERPRTIIGEMKEPCDVVLAIRLDFDYSPTEALEIPADISRALVGPTASSAGPAAWLSTPTYDASAPPSWRRRSSQARVSIAPLRSAASRGRLRRGRRHRCRPLRETGVGRSAGAACGRLRTRAQAALRIRVACDGRKRAHLQSKVIRIIERATETEFLQRCRLG